MSAVLVVARFLRRSWDTIGLAALIVAFLVATVPLSPIAAWIPRIVLVLTLVPIVMQLVIEFRELSGGTVETPGTAPAVSIPPASPATTVPARGTSHWGAALWLIALLAAVSILGTAVGSALYCLAFLRWHARDSWMASGLIAVVLGATIQFIFGGLLHATLYQGWVGTLAR